MNEALRLADALCSGERYLVHAEAATELRRLHDLHGKANALCRIRAERIKELEALNAELMEALRVAVKLNSFREFNDHIPAMKAALAKVEASK